jgi:hypothetical protein
MLAACLLALAACSATSGRPGTPPGASVSAVAVATAAVQESGRTLTQAQLLSAGVPAPQWPKDLTRLLDAGSEWQASQPATSPLPQAPPACTPLLDVIYGTSGASAAVQVGFQRYGDVIVGEVDLASYPHGRASALFASVRRAVSACAGFTATNAYGTYHDKIVPLQGPRLGDESISFGLTREVTGGESLDRFDYVRVGAATVLIRQIGASAAVPPVVPTLLAPQVAKLEAAQS